MPLGLAVCYGCGHLLWSTVDGAHTFVVTVAFRQTYAAVQSNVHTSSSSLLTFTKSSEWSQSGGSSWNSTSWLLPHGRPLLTLEPATRSAITNSVTCLSSYVKGPTTTMTNLETTVFSCYSLPGFKLTPQLVQVLPRKWFAWPHLVHSLVRCAMIQHTQWHRIRREIQVDSIINTDNRALSLTTILHQ